MHRLTIPTAQAGGTAEVAATLECPKQQVYALRQREDFPDPVLTLAATPVWDLRDIRTFKDTWSRRKTLTAAS